VTAQQTGTTLPRNRKATRSGEFSREPVGWVYRRGRLKFSTKFEFRFNLPREPASEWAGFLLRESGRLGEQGAILRGRPLAQESFKHMIHNIF
jgi:hypothetical protein